MFGPTLQRRPAVRAARLHRQSTFVSVIELAAHAVHVARSWIDVGKRIVDAPANRAGRHPRANCSIARCRRRPPPLQPSRSSCRPRTPSWSTANSNRSRNRACRSPALPVMLTPVLFALGSSAFMQASPPAGTLAAVAVAVIVGAVDMKNELNASGCWTASVTLPAGSWTPRVRRERDNRVAVLQSHPGMQVECSVMRHRGCDGGRRAIRSG